MNPLGRNFQRVASNGADDINARIEMIIKLYDSGGNPNEFMGKMFQSNPNFNAMNNQLRSMTQGKNTTDFLLEYARQNGVSEQNLQGLARILGVK